jgi:RNA polymerase-interacting CarD/CdnL/TRCF family regulator
METQGQETATQAQTATITSQNNGSTPFTPGTVVVYGMHGKCTVLGIETRQIGGESLTLYKLEVLKSALSRSTRREPAIWVPVSKAAETGLRAAIGETEIEAVYKTFESREYYFNAGEAWHLIQPKLEHSIRVEGAQGLAKVWSYLFVLKRKQVVAAPEVAKMLELVSKLLIREISDVTQQHSKSIEEKIQKMLKHKLQPDN